MRPTIHYSPGTGTIGAWFHKSRTLNNFNIGFRHLDAWVVNGWVRTAKLDERQQGRRVYSATDVESVLTAISEGREPRRVAGRGGAA